MNIEKEEWKQLVINNDKWDYLVSNTGKIKVIITFISLNWHFYYIYRYPPTMSPMVTLVANYARVA